MLEFAVNPMNVVTVCFQLYRDQLEAAKISEDDFDELCGAEQIDDLRTEVTQQMSSFSNFWKILSTEMEALQSGDSKVMERLAAKAVETQEVSGPSS